MVMVSIDRAHNQEGQKADLEKEGQKECNELPNNRILLIGEAWRTVCHLLQVVDCGVQSDELIGVHHYRENNSTHLDEHFALRRIRFVEDEYDRASLI